MNSFLLGSRSYVVVAPLAVVQLNSGRVEHVYSGGLVPADAVMTVVDQMLNDGFIREIGGHA